MYICAHPPTLHDEAAFYGIGVMKLAYMDTEAKDIERSSRGAFVGD